MALDSVGLGDPSELGPRGSGLAAITVSTAPAGAVRDSVLERPRTVITIEFLRN